MSKFGLGTNFPPHTYSSIFNLNLQSEGDGIVSADSFKTSNAPYKCECLKSSMDSTIFIIALALYMTATAQLNCSRYDLAESRTFKSFHEFKSHNVTFDKTTTDYRGTNLNFSSRNISKVPSNAFETSTSRFITGLDLRNNAITTLEDKAFASLCCLSVLDLSLNKLVNIETNVFENLTNLESLNISGNTLVYVHSEAFSSLAALKILDISFNNLTQLFFPHRDETFMIETLNISHNRFKTLNNISFDDLVRLKELKLNNNEVAMFFFSSFRQNIELEKLDLSSNQMVVIDFKEINVGFKHMKVLNLSNNYLQLYAIACGIVTNFTSKTVVDLNLKDIDCDEWKLYTDIFRTYHVTLAPGRNFFAKHHINGFECTMALNPHSSPISKETELVRECIEKGQNGGGLFQHINLVLIMIVVSFLLLFAVNYFVGWSFMRKLIEAIRGLRTNEDTVSLSYAQLTLDS
ncbi:leucine-rich repeat transmembrane neuronal protein 2 isoform X2 [Euwallacea fornicatus]|uniref:leucine-rich repeat transmembrane neuronal protein 2 isoform X2 n=1 Tax=Euwallacea fornicatus TaxID=995702 RepID=UPI00338FE5C5